LQNLPLYLFSSKPSPSPPFIEVSALRWTCAYYQRVD
jgi:hypothetical protein